MYVDTRFLAQCIKTATFLHEVNTKMKAGSQKKITNPIYNCLTILPTQRGAGAESVE